MITTVLNVTNDGDFDWYVSGYNQPLTFLEAEELAGAPKKIESLEQKLKVAVEALEKISNDSNVYDIEDAEKVSREALEKLKDK